MFVDTKTAEVLKPFTPRDHLKGFARRQIMRGAYLANWRFAATRTRSPEGDFYYLGHHKCASHWMRKFLYHLALVVRANYRVHQGVPYPDFQSPHLRRTIHLNVNADAEAFRAVPAAARGFHVIRDPRDALVSDYFSRRYSHVIHNEWNVRMREFLDAHPMEEGLIYLMDQSPYFQQMVGWDLGSRDNILDIKYEDLVASEFATFKRILAHLHIEIPDDRLQRIVDRCSFRSLSRGRQQGREDHMSPFRKGVAGDWRNHMPEGSRVYEEFQRRWGGLVVDLGYE
jgi:hypothetical protein